MTDAVPREQIEAAEAYEALFVPALFGQWAPRVTDAAGVESGHAILDVACGTGVLARAVASRTGPAGRVVGLDPSPGMLAVAARLSPDVEFEEGVAEALPFEDGAFDAVVSQFGLMFFDDRERALRESLRVLASGGRLAVAVFGSLDDMPAYAAEVGLLERMAGRPAADALRAPFVLGDSDALAALFADAGATSVQIATERGTARFPSARVMVEADLRGWLPVMGVVLSEERIAAILEEAERVLDPYVTPDGTVAFDLSARIVTATRTRDGTGEALR